MKRSLPFTYGYYQWEWRENKIEVVEWSEAPVSTKQWVYVEEPKDPFELRHEFYLEGTCNEDIELKIAPPAIESLNL